MRTKTKAVPTAIIASPTGVVEYFNIKEAALLLRCSKGTIRNRVASGDLKPHKHRKGLQLIFSRAELLGDHDEQA